MGRSLNDRTVNFCPFSQCGHLKLQMRPTILVSLKCTGSHQRNGTSPVCIRCMHGSRDTVVFDSCTSESGSAVFP